MPKLDWVVVNHRREVSFHLLRCNEELSVGTKRQLAGAGRRYASAVGSKMDIRLVSE